MQIQIGSKCLLAVGLLVASGCSTSNTAPYDDAGSDDTGSPPTQGLDATTGGSDSGRDAAGPISADATPGADANVQDAGTGEDGATPDAGGSSDAAASDAATEAAAADASGDASEDAGPLPAILGAWSFDEGTGTSSADLSGNGHAAVFADGGVSWGAGKEGTGLVLDGTTGYADVGVTLVDTTKSFTVMSWVDLAVVNTWEVAVSEDDVNGSLFGLKLRGDGTNDFDFDVETSDIMSPGFVVAQATTSAQASVWTHLAGVYDASGQGAVKVYVNGALEANAAVGQALVAATGHFVIGRGLYNGVTGSFLNGTLDEVAVYGGALSDAQVAAIYSAQK